MEHAHHSKIKEKTTFPSTQEIFNTKFLVKLSRNLLIFYARFSLFNKRWKKLFLDHGVIFSLNELDTRESIVRNRGLNGFR